jgi:hypothetical protein
VGLAGAKVTSVKDSSSKPVPAGQAALVTHMLSEVVPADRWLAALPDRELKKGDEVAPLLDGLVALMNVASSEPITLVGGHATVLEMDGEQVSFDVKLTFRRPTVKVPETVEGIVAVLLSDGTLAEPAVLMGDATTDGTDKGTGTVTVAIRMEPSTESR